MFEARKIGETFFADLYSKAVKNRLYEYAFERTELRNIDKKAQKAILARKGYARSVALSKNAAVAMLSLDAIPYTEAENDILQRFSKVFDQAYTRFLDLQRAEAQARESQIDVAPGARSSPGIGYA